jgi:uncharacterized damage-inducible protein DinB
MRWVSTGTGRSHQIWNPSTGEVQAEVTLGDAALLESWQFKKGGSVIVEMPRGAVIRSILLNHGIHHRGQLSVYLRLLDVPVPSIYGPSADENPFG